MIKYCGHVVSLDDDSFGGNLVPVSEDSEDMYADILISAVPERDRHMIVEGAVFYWRICETRGSTIHFCRNYNRKPIDIEKIKKRGAELAKAIGWTIIS